MIDVKDSRMWSGAPPFVIFKGWVWRQDWIEISNLADGSKIPTLAKTARMAHPSQVVGIKGGRI
jgi:hypothetical protein